MKISSLKYVFLYRTFLFRFTTFETDNKNLKIIVNALNIKKRKKRIEYIYDETINIINKYYYMDLCKFKDNKCIVQRKANSNRINGCCRMCNLVTEKGCPSSNVACKLLYCKTALKNVKQLKMRDIKILKCLSIKQRIILKSAFFETRQQVINDLNYGIILYGIKALFREIKRDLFRLKKVNHN